MGKIEETIYERKSIRNYSDKKVPAEDLKALAEAAIWSPNAMNAQNWHFTVVGDEKLIERMADSCRKGMLGAPVEFLQNKAKDPNFKGLYGAPAAIVVSRKEEKFTMFDCGTATQTICLLAKERGLDTCVTAMTEFMFAGDPQLKADLCIPEEYLFTCLILVGYAVDGPDDHVRDRKEDVITYIL